MPGGDSVAGTPRRIQFGIARPDQIKVGKTLIRSSAFDVREWYQRQLIVGRLSKEQIAIIEALIEDLELA